MILVILGICIVMVIVGAIITATSYYDEIGEVLCTISSVIGAVALIVTTTLTIRVSTYPAIQKEIVMYQEENAAIESRLEETVKAYQQYETDIFKDISKDNLMTYVTLFPELKSDTLVQKQIETYVSNNNKIKDLKSELIYIDVEKWWLYFGGGTNE